MEPFEIDSRLWKESGEFSDKVQWLEQGMGCSISVRYFQFITHQAIAD
jgi:hypothetical protein